MIDTTIPQLILVLITAIAGMVAIGAGMIGYWYRKLVWFERIILVVTGLALIYPEGYSDTIGAAVFAIMFAIQWLGREKKETEAREA